MKKNKIMRIASVLLVAVLLSTCAISGTFAKYTTSATGSSTARVAKWDVDITNGAQTQTFAFDLFKNVQDMKNNGKDKTTDYTENDVKKESGENIIAPGTKGSFDIVLTNASEVTAQYKIEFSATNNNNIPLEFSLDENATEWKTNITDLNTQFAKLSMGEQDNTATVTVYWKWAFVRTDNKGNSQDTEDTALATDPGEGEEMPEITVTATVTVEQVD